MIIRECHFVDMLPEIRYMLDNYLLDEECLGKYDSFCKEWIGELLGLLKESGNTTFYAEVKKCYNNMIGAETNES